MAKLLIGLSIILFSLSFVSTTSATIKSTGQTILLNAVYYYAPPDVITTIAMPASYRGGLMAVTVVTTKDASFGDAAFTALKSHFTATDDVWQEGFSDALYLQYTGSGTYTASFGMGMVLTAKCNASSAIPPGPYFLSPGGELFEAYRLYSDSVGAFTETVYASPGGGITVLPAGIPGQNLAVAVPSRLYFTKSNEKPLAGVRIGVKDLFDIAGLRTSNGNRAWYHFYPEANTTGTAIQNLIDAGGVVVGKLKMSQFANGERATADWVDYLEPFNPRGKVFSVTQCFLNVSC
jgi:hypothetical protein